MAPEIALSIEFFTGNANCTWLPKRDHRTEGWPTDCAFFLCRFVKLAYWDLGYTFLQDLNTTESPASHDIVHLSWWLYIFKLGELADTVFFVLRKKNQQISALHVVHHVIVPWNLWMNVTYASQTHMTFIICLNSFVHVFCNFSCWSVHAVGMMFAKGNYVGLFVWLEAAQAIMLLVWFCTFYVQAYTKKNP
ncbi:hypothetical protein MRX96_025344 [Rhipicephalus microplus]